MDAAERKRALRAEARRLRDAIPAKERAEAVRRIAERVIALEAFEKAKLLALYADIGSEVETSALEEAARKDGKITLYPRVTDGQLVFHAARRAELVPGFLRIPEPRGAPYAQPPDLIIVPGLAFDLACHRLGYGKGFYDRALAGSKASKIGLAFEAQIVPELPRESWDLALDLVVTETRVI